MFWTAGGGGGRIEALSGGDADGWGLLGGGGGGGREERRGGRSLCPHRTKLIRCSELYADYSVRFLVCLLLTPINTDLCCSYFYCENRSTYAQHSPVAVVCLFVCLFVCFFVLCFGFVLSTHVPDSVTANHRDV